ncbi:MAG: hypothetical protein DMG13_27475 [Acidobacteria bacterium]|nr:MAG: hypothetical protein DMG13_27475 [Acidobacteriota bacterium]
MKKHLETIVLALFGLFLSPCLVYAQSEGAIRGVVTAKADGSLLPNADIRLESSVLPAPLHTETGDDGHFGFQRLIPGHYTLVASHAGFQEQTIEFTLKPREVQNITLELSLQRVVQSADVTAQGELLGGTYSPNSTTMQKQTVDDLPVDQRNNMPDMIAVTAPGMIRSHDDFVHVRGNEIALNTFINGVSFWENPHSVFSAGLSPDIIQTANVMTGGFPAEYGNRFGGVIDIVTKSGLSMNNEGSLTLGVGTALRHNAAIEYGGHTRRVGYYAYSAGFESARFLSPNDPRSIHDTGRGSHNFLQLDFNANPTNFLKLVLMGDGTNFQIPKTSLDDQIRPKANASERTREQSAILTWSHTISNDTLLTTSFYERWSRTELFPANDPLAAVAQNDRKLFTTGLKSDLTRFFGRHTVKGGVDLVMLRPNENLFFYGEGYIAFSHLLGLPHVHLREPDRGPITFAERKTGGQVSGYLQDAVQLTPHLRVDAGLRYDGYSVATSTFHFSPRVNLAYRLSDAGTVVHASYNHFFVPPAVENVLISSAGLTRFLQDRPEALPPLQPIVENQFELGVTHPVLGNFRAGLTGYYRISNNPVHTVLFPDSRIYAYANFDKGKAYGMEIKMEVPVVERLGLSAYLNYALSRVYFWNPVTAGFVDETHHLEEAGRFLAPMDQTHTLNAGFTYRHRKSGLWGGMTFEYGSGTPTEAEDEEGAPMAEPVPLRIPGHFTQNVAIGVDLPRHRERSGLGLQFNVENLTNNVYKVSQESVFSPGEYFNPRFYSGSLKIHF